MANFRRSLGRVIRVGAVFVAGGFWAAASAWAQPPGLPPVRLEQVIGEVKKALATVAGSPHADRLPALDSVTLELETGFVESSKKEVNLVVAAGNDFARSQSQRITLTLRPAGGKTRGQAGASAVSEKLAAALLEVARSISRAGKEAPELELEEVSCTIQFVVRRSEKEGVDISLEPVRMVESGAVDEGQVHSIRLLFKKKKG
jgi:hypothetical protein